MLTRIKIFAPALLTIVLMLTPIFFAAAESGGTGIGNPTGGTGIGNPTGGTGSNSSYTLQNPLGVSSICQLIGLLLKAAIAIGIPIAVLFIVWAGFKFVLARGSPGELSEARSNLIATLIGIAIFLGASLIANVIISTLHQLGVNGVNSC